MKVIPGLLLALFLPFPAGADDYPRQPGIDVQHYRFQVELSDDTDEIIGETTVDVRYLEADVKQVWLDLAGARAGKGMVVTAVTSGGEAVPFTHASDRLQLALASPPASGSRASFTVRYHGIAANGLHIAKNSYGERTFFSWNWPTMARQWLPVVDHPYDKATSEFLITAPSRCQVVANGRLVEERDLGSGRRLTHWREDVPVAVWLNNIGVAEFASRHFDTALGVPLQTWVFPRDREKGIGTFEEPMRQALGFFSDYIGPYPYEKLAAVQVNGMGGGMEHASAVFYDAKEVTGKPAFSLVAHEVSHQWWGDSVTEKDWDDAWLSEGFATYFAALAQEHYQGRDAFVQTMSRSRAAILQLEKRSGSAVIHDNLREIRDGRAPAGLVYQKGGWTLHMLRSVLGPDKFRQGIREYYRRFRDASASTEDLRSVMEEVSGQDLAWFFAQWLRRAQSPVLQVEWSYDREAKKVVLDIAQKQPGELYRLPLTVALAFPSGPQKPAAINVAAQSERFEVPCDTEPANVLLDPSVEVLMESHIVRK